jgi:hypothetical protein
MSRPNYPRDGQAIDEDRAALPGAADEHVAAHGLDAGDMSSRLPAMVTSSTGKRISPPSTQKPGRRASSRRHRVHALPHEVGHEEAAAHASQDRVEVELAGDRIRLWLPPALPVVSSPSLREE